MRIKNDAYASHPQLFKFFIHTPLDMRRLKICSAQQTFNSTKLPKIPGFATENRDNLVKMNETTIAKEESAKKFIKCSMRENIYKSHARPIGTSEI